MDRVVHIGCLAASAGQQGRWLAASSPLPPYEADQLGVAAVEAAVLAMALWRVAVAAVAAAAAAAAVVVVVVVVVVVTGKERTWGCRCAAAAFSAVLFHLRRILALALALAAALCICYRRNSPLLAVSAVLALVE